MTRAEFHRVLIVSLGVVVFASLPTIHALVHSSQEYTVYRVSQEGRQP